MQECLILQHSKQNAKPNKLGFIKLTCLNPMLRNPLSQLLNNSTYGYRYRQTQRKIQQQDLLKSKGFMSPKITSQERVNNKAQAKSRGNHMKTQPNSNQSSQIKMKSVESLQDDSPKQLFKNQHYSPSTKAESLFKQQASDTKQKHSSDLLARLNFQTSLTVSSVKHKTTQFSGAQIYQLQNHQKSNSAQYIESQKLSTQSSSQPRIEILTDKIKTITTRKFQQDLIQIILQFRSFKQKMTIDISTNKISHLVELIKDELNKKFVDNDSLSIIGIKTYNISIPIDYILSSIDRPLSLLSNCPNQPLIIEPILQAEQENRSSRVCLKDFEFIRCIGMGGFSKVYMVREKRSGQFYAMKLIEKNSIISQNKQIIIQNERDIMSNLNHPFIVKIQYAFESRRYLVFVLEYCSGGELFFLLRKVKRMSEEQAFFYFAEICLGMKHLHDRSIIYRDIKPENILIDFDGHVRIADFGLSKQLDQEIAYSFCGSPEYMAPEMLLKQGHNLQLDLYCLGALLYELITGLPPFYSRNTDEIYQRILNQKLSYPQHVQMSPLLKELLNGLLAKNPKNRIDKIETLLRHPWMTQWGDKYLYKDLLSKKIDPPFKPDCFSFNFDEEEFGQGEAEFLQSIKTLQQNIMENFPKETILKNFYYNPKEINLTESTRGTNLSTKILEEQSGTQRQKSKRFNTYDDDISNYVNEQKILLLNQLRLQTENELKRKSA
ncbi:unnamed protein product [Paramecium octaurelia]|uniref:Protein kinase domain-containing protein n=1 Tax=Paramecium octaurelia TaxID=43137 RepID=A0A8S1XY74_PAROT|nr:unnamed protein product [Paramecium octaurelia]